MITALSVAVAAVRRLRLPAKPIRLLSYGTLLIGGGWLWGMYCQPASILVIDLHEADGVAVRGGVLDIIATVQARNTTCITHVRRWLWRDDPGEPGRIEWVYLRDVPYRPPVAVGFERYRLLVPVPAWVEPGDWHYRAEADDDCAPWRAWFWPRRQSPDLVVHITDPTPANPAEVVAPPGAVTVIPTATGSKP